MAWYSSHETFIFPWHFFHPDRRRCGARKQFVPHAICFSSSTNHALAQCTWPYNIYHRYYLFCCMCHRADIVVSTKIFLMSNRRDALNIRVSGMCALCALCCWFQVIHVLTEWDGCWNAAGPMRASEHSGRVHVCWCTANGCGYDADSIVTLHWLSGRKWFFLT